MAKLRMKMVECYYCDKCKYEKLLNMEDDRHLCDCGGELVVVWRAEMPMPLRASYHDGNNRFALEKDWSKLNKEKSEAGNNHDFKKQKEVEKEMKEVRKHRTKDERFNNK